MARPAQLALDAPQQHGVHRLVQILAPFAGGGALAGRVGLPGGPLLPTHRKARRTPAEREQLIAGLIVSFGGEAGGPSGDSADGDD